MAEVTMGAATGIGTLEYQLFSEWYQTYYGKQPPTNSAELRNDPAYTHWRTYVRPSVWTPKQETEAAVASYDITPETQAAYGKWFTSIYGREPYGAALEPGSIWQQNWRRAVESPPGAPPRGEAGITPTGEADMGQVVIPNKLVQMPDGSYVDYNGMPVTTEVARRMLQEYAMESPEYVSQMQQRQTGIQEQQQLREDWRSQQNLLAQRHEYGAQRMASWRAGESDITDEERASIFEQGQHAIMAQWRQDPYRNWIKIQTEQMNPTPNPFRKEALTAHEEAGAAKVESDAAEKSRQLAKEELEALDIKPERAGALLAQAQTPEGYAQMSEMSRGLLDEAAQAVELQNRIQGFSQRRITARQQELRFMQSPDYAEEEKRATWEEGGVRTHGSPDTGRRKPTTPLTPDWLKKLYPTLGERLPTQQAATQAAPLSGQALSGLGPNELSGWMGYAEYSGAEPERLLWQTQQMIPQARRGTGWAAARQR